MNDAPDTPDDSARSGAAEVSAGSPDTPRTRSWRRTFLEIAFILAITLVILEILLRCLGLTNPVLYVADEHSGYRLKPEQQVSYLGNTIVINRWGVRDSREFTGKTSGMRRVVVLGDSVTWGGIRVRQEALFTSIAESALPDTEIINCGVNGYSITQMSELYQHHLASLEPDVVIVFAIPRDFTRPPLARLTGDGAAFPQEPPRSAILAALAIVRELAVDRFEWDWLRAGTAALPESVPDTAMDAIELHSESLSEFVANLDGISLVIVLLPTAAGTPDADAVGPIEEALRNRNLSFVNLADRMTIEPELFVDGVHLTTAGHDQVGRALADVLASAA